MDSGLTAAFWGVSMLFVLTPGVDWAYALASGLRRGGVVPAVSGMLAGHLTATVVGLPELPQSSPPLTSP